MAKLDMVLSKFQAKIWKDIYSGKYDVFKK